MQATNLKTNHLTQPLGIDAGTLFLSWQCAEGVRQTAYEIEVTAGAETLWASGKILSSVMHTETPTPVPPKTQGQWRIRLWDENNQPGAWSEAVFETGLPFADWQGVWVCPETEEPDIDCTDAINAFAKPNWEQKQAALEASGKGTAQPYQPHRPASYLRKVFTVPEGESKRLYITAKGLYTAWLNGKRVGDRVLAPGSFTADKHLGVQTYDVTVLVHPGENELLIALGDGWYRSTSGVDGDRDLFGKELAVLFQLEVDGKAVCVSDDAMEATQCGPIRQNDLQQGEVYDARLEGELTGWHGVRTAPNTLPLIGMNTVPIREQEAFAGRLLRTPNGLGTAVRVLPEHPLEAVCAQVAACAGVVGVVNMEFIVNDSGAWFLEVNPRFSGGVGFSVLAGVDFPALNLLCHAGEAIGSRAPVREMTLARRSSPVITEI